MHLFHVDVQQQMYQGYKLRLKMFCGQNIILINTDYKLENLSIKINLTRKFKINVKHYW
jgi:hypothetical protein